MDATIKLKNKPNIIGAASNFTYLWGINSGLSDRDAIRLAIAVSEIVTDVVLFAFLEQEGELDISFQRHDDRVEIIIHELGEPFNPDRYNYDVSRVLRNGHFEGAGIKLIKALTSSFIFINKGKKGKEFRLLQYVTAKHITKLYEKTLLQTSESIAPEDEEYTIGIITADDAENIAKLIYRTYGLTYHKEGLYFPKKIALAIQQKERFGVITYTSNHEPAGYFAIVMSTDSNIGEVGEAVVAQKHRRRGVMTKMLSVLVTEAERKSLHGVFGEANAAHIFSQKTNAKFNFKSSAILIGMSTPMQMKGIDNKYWGSRMCAVFEFLALKRPLKNPVYLPPEYRSIILELYKSLQLNAQESSNATNVSPSETEIEIKVDYEDQVALLVVRNYGDDFEESLKQITSDLDKNEMEVQYIDLPLFMEKTREIVPTLKRNKFIFSGLIPMYHQEQDYLRMQRLNMKVDFDLMHIYSENAKKINKIVIKEYYDLYPEK